jgi:hypothetical protein
MNSATFVNTMEDLGPEGALRADVVYVPRFRYAFWSDAPARTGLAYVGPMIYRHYASRAVERDGPVNGTLRNVVLYVGRVSWRFRAVSNQDAMLATIRAHLQPGLELQVLIDPTNMHDTAMWAARALVLLAPHGGAMLVRACCCCMTVRTTPSTIRDLCRRAVPSYRLRAANPRHVLERASTDAVCCCCTAQNSIFMRPDPTSHVVEINDAVQFAERPYYMSLTNGTCAVVEHALAWLARAACVRSLVPAALQQTTRRSGWPTRRCSTTTAGR